MPRYCFRVVKSGSRHLADELAELVMPIAELEEMPRDHKGRYTLPDGSLAKRAYGAEHGPRQATGDQAWPLISEAAGVHPSQVEEAREHARKHGVPTDFTSDGRAVFRDRAHRRDYCKLIGVRDNHGGYGDA